MGHLSRIIARARLYMDETATTGPSANPRFSDAAILDLIRDAWRMLIRELNQYNKSKPLVNIQFSVTKDVGEYHLPPHIAEVVDLEELDPNNTDITIRRTLPRHRNHRFGPNWFMSGPTLVFDPVPYRTGTWKLKFAPNAEISPHDGTGTLIATDDGASVTAVTQMTLASSPTTGDLETRKYGLVGYVLRILTSAGDWGASGAITESIVQEVMITAHDNETRKVTFAPGLDPLPGWTGTSLDDASCTYEVLPAHWNQCEAALSFLVCRMIAASVGDRIRKQDMNEEYQAALRSIRQMAGQQQQVVANAMARGVRR